MSPVGDTRRHYVPAQIFVTPLALVSTLLMVPSAPVILLRDRIFGSASPADRHYMGSKCPVPAESCTDDYSRHNRAAGHGGMLVVTVQIQTKDVLDVSGLVKRYGDLTAVDGVSFHIRAGETYGLLGPNGAGKTTIISMVAGLVPANAGTVRVAGRDMTPSETEAKRSIGLVPQELAIYPDLTARENLKFFGRLQGITGKELTRRTSDVLELIGLSDRAGDLTKKYSGGMKRRLNIGIGLLHRPTLLILDEPTVGVDPQSRNSILESVERLSVEGMAVLYTTHYMEEAERLCDRIAILDEGLIQAEGTRDELITLTGGVDRSTCAAAAACPWPRRPSAGCRPCSTSTMTGQDLCSRSATDPQHWQGL